MNKGRAIGLLVLVLSVLPIAKAWGAERISGDIRIFLPEAGYLGIEIRDVREVEVNGLGFPRKQESTSNRCSHKLRQHVRN